VLLRYRRKIFIVTLDMSIEVCLIQKTFRKLALLTYLTDCFKIMLTDTFYKFYARSKLNLIKTM